VLNAFPSALGNHLVGSSNFNHTFLLVLTDSACRSNSFRYWHTRPDERIYRYDWHMNSTYWLNKKCVLTGGSSGLGVSIARALLTRGAHVVLVARNEEKLVNAASNLGDRAGEVTPFVADVTREEDVARLFVEVESRWGQLDFLCNSAGRSARGRALDTTPDDFQQLLDVNFLAAVRTTRAFAAMLLQQQGHLVNIGSLASKIAPRYMGGYPASKFALAAYTQQVRLELSPQGLHVLQVCPGPILRDNTEPRFLDHQGGLPAEAQRPAAGAKLRGIDPDWLAGKILDSCQRRRPELIVPWKVRLLVAVSQFSPRLGDWLLLRATTN